MSRKGQFKATSSRRSLFLLPLLLLLFCSTWLALVSPTTSSTAFADHAGGEEGLLTDSETHLDEFEDATGGDARAPRVKRVSLTDEAGKELKSSRARASKEGGGGGSPSSFRGGFDLPFPLVMPPYGVPKGAVPDEKSPGCLLYAEGVVVSVADLKKKEMGTVVLGIDEKGQPTASYGYEEGQVNCLTNASIHDKTSWPKKFSFLVRVQAKGSAGQARPRSKSGGEGGEGGRNAGDAFFSLQGPLELKLNFEMIPNNRQWFLASVEPVNLSLKKGTLLPKDISIGREETNVRPDSIAASNGYSYACSRTPSIATWKVDGEEKGSHEVGVSFVNMQLQPHGVKFPKDPGTGKSHAVFSAYVSDCMGTFSSGSWMGIVVALLLATVLLLGFLMLNSVQTMDRFDDPKQKQLIINAKE